jgi:EAL domain-containing protein (putative c-di-GMP-specific phosphodiesterase class I)
VKADIIKIDGKLIENLASSKDSQEQVREIVELAHGADRQCIAECVSDPRNLALLWNYRLDYIQGNFVQEPSRELGYDFSGEIA